MIDGATEGVSERHRGHIGQDGLVVLFTGLAEHNLGAPGPGASSNAELTLRVAAPAVDEEGAGHGTRMAQPLTVKFVTACGHAQ